MAAGRKKVLYNCNLALKQVVIEINQQLINPFALRANDKI
jgi:hypothetical protein